MSTTRIEGSVYVNGNVAALSMTIPAGAVGDAQVPANAAIDASKLQHQHRPQIADNSATTAADFVRPIHRVRGSVATLVEVVAGLVDPSTGDATVAIDLLKNGTSILTAPIELNNTHAARQAVAATIANASLVAGDLLEVDVDATAGGGALGAGLFVQITVNERAQ